MAYSKQTWDTTSYVTPTRMNHIEEGIESAGVENLITVNQAGASKTATSLLNELYTALTALANETVYDGYIEWGGIIYRCSRKDSGDYMFESAQITSTSLQVTVLSVASSGSKMIRVSVNYSTNAVTSNDMSSTSFNTTLNFNGKMINEPISS